MKKFICALLSVIMIFSLTACGASAQPPEEKEKTAADDSMQSGIRQETEAEEKRPETAIEEAVLFEESGLKVTVKGLGREEFIGPAVKLLIENNSDKNYTVQARNTSVNGYMMEPMFSCNVAAGKKANDSLDFMDGSLEKVGITEIACIETSFYIFNTDDWAQSFNTDIFTIKTSAYDGFQFTYDDTGELLYEDDALRIISKGISPDASFLGPSIVVYIENKSDAGLMVQARDVSVNGFMTEPVFSANTAPGKHNLTEIAFLSTALEENDIQEITEVELSFQIYEDENWLNSYETSPIALSFP